MTDSGGPLRRPLCFLSTLLSQKVPEKSDTVLRCIISGQPKPEVTWYKNGQTIEEGGIVSSYEFFENQYIHLLHLYSCTQNDTAVYQISAKNCFGMICCSASIEVECSPENTQLVPSPTEDGTTGWNPGPQTSGQKSTNQVEEQEPPSKEEESLWLGTPVPADSSSSKFNPLCSCQLLASSDMNSSGSENPLHAEGTRQREQACDANSTESIADGLLFPKSSNIPDKQDVYCHGTVQSKLSKLTDGALNDDEDFHSSPQSPKAQKYISVSLPLSEAATSTYPGDRAPVNEQISSQVSSDDSDSDYELCPEITLTYTEEFSDDDLEYLECSDVMTDYSNAVWQRNLEGTEHVFLLESDDEEMEFSKYGLGEHESLLSEMGRGPRVSDDTGPMEARAGFSGDHSQSQEVTVRRHRASTHGPPCPQTGMTLTLGSHQDGTSAVTDQGRYKRPTASAENDYPGIQGETRDSHPAGKEFASDKPLTVDKAVAEREGKCWSGELETSGMNQCLEMVAEERLGERGSWSKGCSEKPGRTRRPGMKGKPKKLTPDLKDSATDDTLHRPQPPEPSGHPLTQGERKESSGAAAEAPSLNSQFCPEVAILTHADGEAKMLQTPPGTLPRQGGSDLEGERVQVDNLCETSRAPDQSAHPQVQIQDTARETLSPSRTPAFSEPAQEGSVLPGTTADSVSSLERSDDERAPLIPYLDRESCTQGPRREESQGREDDTPGYSWEDPGYGLSPPEATHATLSPCELSVCLPTEGSDDPGEPETLSVSPPAPTDTVPTLGTVCHGLRGREAECLMEHLRAGDQGTGGTMDPPAGAPVHEHLPQEFCSTDLQLVEGQSKVSGLCFPDEGTVEGVFQGQGSEPVQSIGQSNQDGNTVAFPVLSSALPWDTSQKASEGATGEQPARGENSTPTRAATGQGRLSPRTAGGLEDRQSLSSEKSLVQHEEGEDVPGPHAPGPTDTPTSHSSVAKFPQEPATLPANLEGLQGTRESGDAPTGTTATKVHPTKYLPISTAENSCADGPKESLPQLPGENIFQHPSNVQSGHILNGSTPESTEELCTAPRGPGVCVCAPLLPEGELGQESSLQVDNQRGDRSRTVDGVANRSLEEQFQEKGRETMQRTWQESWPRQGSPSEDHVQESWAPMPAARGETVPAPLDHPSASCREERRPCSGPGTSMSTVDEVTVEDDRQTVSSILPCSHIPLEESMGSGPGHGEAAHKPERMALGASVFQACPPGQPADSECKESAAGAMTPAGAWAVGDTRQAGAAGPELDPSEPAPSAGGPQAEPGSALADNRDIHEGQKPARRTYWRCLSARYLSQRRLLESSVDPVEEELCVTDLPSEASTTGGQETVHSVSQNQEEKQLMVALPAFFKSFLTSPKILESSVDPIDEIGVVEWARLETREPSASTLGLSTEDRKLEDGHLGQRAEVRPASSPVPCPQQSGGTIPSTDRNQEASERGEAEQSQNSGADLVSPTLPLSSGLAVMTQASAGVDIQNTTGQVHDIPPNCLVEPSNCERTLSASEESGERGGEGGKQSPSSGGLIPLPFTSSPEGNITNFPISHKIEEPEKETPQSGETKTASRSSSPAMTLAFTSGEHESETAPKTQQDPCQLGPALGHGSKSGGERPRPMAARTGSPPATATEEGKRKQETSGSGRLAEGMKKKILSKVAALRLRLEERENVRKNSRFPAKVPKLEMSVLCTSEQKDPKELPCKREGKAFLPFSWFDGNCEILADHFIVERFQSLGGLHGRWQCKGTTQLFEYKVYVAICWIFISLGFTTYLETRKCTDSKSFRVQALTYI